MKRLLLVTMLITGISVIAVEKPMRIQPYTGETYSTPGMGYQTGEPAGMGYQNTGSQAGMGYQAPEPAGMGYQAPEQPGIGYQNTGSQGGMGYQILE